VEKALIVAPNGELTACYEVCGPEHPLARDFFFGTITNDGYIKEEPEARQKLQDKITERRSLCETCFCYWHCAGDCPPKTLSPDGEGHRHFGARCDLNRLITRELLVRYMADGHGLWQGESKVEVQLLRED
jgi:radical SAM protein with 4Fe4S-binding SPASM domain